MKKLYVIMLLVFVWGIASAQNWLHYNFSMMKSHSKIVFIILFLGFTLTANSQKRFQRTFGASAFGGFSGLGDTTITIVKTDSLGTPQWVKTYGWPNTLNDGFPLMQTSDGGYLIGGDLDVHNSGIPILIKIDSAGNMLWNKPSQMFDNPVQKTMDGGYASVRSGWICKADSAFNIQWARYYNGYLGTSVQGGEQTTDGGYIMAGITQIIPGDDDVMVTKTDSLGKTQWSKIFRGTGEDVTSEQHCALQTQDGGYIIYGHTSSFGVGGFDLFLIKIDNTGNVQWTRTYGGIYGDFAVDMKVVNGGEGYILTGFTNGFEPPPYQHSRRTFLIRIDGSGNVMWGKMYGDVINNPWNGDDRVGSLVKTADNGFLLSGSTQNFGATVYASWLIKTDVNGVSDGCHEKPCNLNTTVPNWIINPGYGDTVWTCTTYNPVTIVQGTLPITDTLLFCHPPCMATVTCIPTTCGLHNGSATATVSGGTSPFTYVWSPLGQNTQTITGLYPISYTCTVTDTMGVSCHSSCTVSQSSASALTATLTPTSASCYTCVNGSASASVNGGTPPYTYSWSNGTTTQTATGLQPSNYTVTITDSLGCSHTATVTVSFVGGINEIDFSNSISIYPNPTSGVLQIQANSYQLIANSQIEIYNVMGEKIYEQAISDIGTANSGNNSNGLSLITINLSAARSDIYFLQLKTDNGIANKKIVISK